MRIYQIILLGFLCCSNKLEAQQRSNNSLDLIYKQYQANNCIKKDTLQVQAKRFYKNHISNQISANCEFELRCSEFMAMAIQNYGSAKGFLLGIDRITRCGASHDTYNFLPSLISNNESTLIDEIHYYD